MASILVANVYVYCHGCLKSKKGLMKVQFSKTMETTTNECLFFKIQILLTLEAFLFNSLLCVLKQPLCKGKKSFCLAYDT